MRRLLAVLVVLSFIAPSVSASVGSLVPVSSGPLVDTPAVAAFSAPTWKGDPNSSMSRRGQVMEEPGGRNGLSASSSPSGYALEFDGADDFVLITDPTSTPSMDNPYTIEMWAKADQWAGDNRTLIGIGNDIPAYSRVIGIVYPTGDPAPGVLVVHFASDWQTGLTIAENEWHHYAITYDGSVERIYIDGTLRGTGGYNSFDIDSTPIVIGAQSWDGLPSDVFKGTIDEVRIWSVVRSDAEILANFDKTLTGSESGLAAYYRFDEGSGQTAYDGTANHNDGNLGNSSSADGSDPAWVNAGEVAGPLVQVTTHTADDRVPSIVRAADGKIWVVWASYRSGNYDLWYRTTSDEGATWSEDTQLTTDGNGDYSPSIMQASDGKIWVVWESSRWEGATTYNSDIWYKISSDGGATWSSDARLTTDTADDYAPSIMQAADGRVWVVWSSWRPGDYYLWYKTSFDGGATWSADTRLTTGTGNDSSPSIMQMRDGSIWVVWSRAYELCYKTSTDSGGTWSSDLHLPAVGFELYSPSIAQTGDSTIWVAWHDWDWVSPGAEIWYMTSSDGGTTWSERRQWTRFVGEDSSAGIAALTGDRVGIVWSSIRSGNADIWFGIPGEREDISPPPYVSSLEHWPGSNLDNEDVVTFRAYAVDETSVSRADLVWVLNGVSQPDAQMYDDGAHGDSDAGDGWYGVQMGPFAAGSSVQYSARATDGDGNTYARIDPVSFQVLSPFVKTADILFVADYGSYDTTWFRPYFTNALDDGGYAYDVWDSGLRGSPDGSVLNQYTTGVVIWAMPYSGHLQNADSQLAVQGYLDAGGKLFVTGQNVAQYANGSTFLSDYLHAQYVQGETYLYGVNGAVGDPIGDGLALGISGSDGANNQWTTDEINPIAPAVAVFTYDTGAMAALAEPVRRDEKARSDAQRAESRETMGETRPENTLETNDVEPSGIISSGTAGLRVDTGTYKVVYLAYGFEAINTRASRAAVMERVLAWLTGTLPRPMQISPADGSAVPTGLVTFTWSSVVGASGYEIQIDRTETFTSTDLIDATTGGTSYAATLGLGTWYWRVRTHPDGEWTGAWEVRAVGPLVQVTTHASSDYYPSILQAADGKIWLAWTSYRSGTWDLWYKTSSDNGATWSSDTPLTTHGVEDYAPSIMQSLEGKVWVVWYSYLSGNYDLWYKTTSDGGATWSSDTQLTTDPSTDSRPSIVQASDGKVWVAWTSYRSGNEDIWYKTSSDGGSTWSADTQLTTDASDDNHPSIAQAADGKVWVVWYSARAGTGLWYKTSSDGGATWSVDSQFPPGATEWRNDPSIASASDGTLWVASASGYQDIWYQTSSDNGATWSAERQWTRFVGEDSSPAVAALSGGRVGIVWQSYRSANADIWFGIQGEREDISPPPYVTNLNNIPAPNPDSDDVVTLCAYAVDETSVSRVDLVWSVDGVQQADVQMYDDGAHGDGSAGDGHYGVQTGPFALGSRVVFTARATDGDGNTYTSPATLSFQVITPFVRTANTLLVADSADGNTDWFRPYFMNALDDGGYAYDVWDIGQRGGPDGSVLNQYTTGVVVWAMPGWGYLPVQYVQSAVQGYLDAGGKLFVTGQDVAQYNDGNTFLNDYLHAQYVQGATYLYGVNGAVGDPIGDGLSLGTSGGDGANNQYSTDEIDPIAPAVAVFTYDTGSMAALAEPVRLDEKARSEANRAEPRGGMGEVRPENTQDAEDVGPAGITSSGTAGLRVDTGTYKVVYFAYGFEGINTRMDRAIVMDRVLAWLYDRSGPSVLHTPISGVLQNTEVVVSATVTCAVPLTAATLHYRTTGAGAYTNVPMTLLSGDVYQAAIPAAAVTLAGVEYHISASDGTYTNTHPFSGDHQIAVGETYCDIAVGIPKAECDALAALYNGTSGPTWTNNTGWLQTNTPCSWNGVSCSSGHVTGLSLPYNHLSGSIPADLGNLTKLTTLELYFNYLTGTIPSALGDLTNLQSLYLFSNQLSGSAPATLGNLANLQALHLGGNQLSGGIPAELGNLTNLRYLYLHFNQLSGNIPAQLGSLTNLDSLYLMGNQLSGSIPAELGNLVDLQYLYLGQNQLSGGIPAELGNLTYLRELQLSSNQLGGEIPASITNLVNLNGDYPEQTSVGYNMLMSSDPAVITFLNGKDPDWSQTQTVPPTGLAVTGVTTTTVQLSWTSILYTGDGGYYEVGYSTTAGGPYTVHGATVDKSVTGYLVTGLTPGTPYYFAVRTYTPAHDSQQNELWSGFGGEVTATTVSNATPVAVLVSPTGYTSMPDFMRAFLTVYQDNDGWQDLANVYFMWNNSAADGVQQVRYEVATRKLYIRNDANTDWVGGFTPGTAVQLSNTNLTLDVSQSSVVTTTTQVRVTWGLIPKQPVTAVNWNQYLKAVDSASQSTGWVNKGTWRVNMFPNVGGLSPASGNAPAGTAQTFTITYSDEDGVGTINTAYIRATMQASPFTEHLRAYYNRVTNRMFLWTGSAWIGALTPGVAGTAETTYAILDAGASSVTQSGKILTVNWNITFKAGTEGVKDILGYVYDNQNFQDGYLLLGNWTVGASPLVSEPDAVPPAADDPIPLDAPLGFKPVFRVPELDPASQLSGMISPDQQRQFGAAVPLEESVPKPAMKEMPRALTDRQPSPLGMPVAGIFTPVQGNRAPGWGWNFRAQVSDPSGFGHLAQVYVLFSMDGGTQNAIYIRYDQNTNKVYLRDSADTVWIGGYAPGSNMKLSNKNGTLDVALTRVATYSTNYLDLYPQVIFKGLGQSQHYRIFVAAEDDAGNTLNWVEKGWHRVDMWAANGGLTPSADTVAVGTSHSYTTTYTDPEGASDLKYVYFNVASSAGATNQALYARYNVAGNVIEIRNDGSTAWLGPITPGQAQDVQNSWVIVHGAGSSATINGDRLTVVWSVEFRDTLVGTTKNAYLYSQDKFDWIDSWRYVGNIQIMSP